MLFDVIVTSQVERLAHALNVSLRKQRANVHLKARRFRHCASHALDYTDVAVSFVKTNLGESRFWNVLSCTPLDETAGFRFSGVRTMDPGFAKRISTSYYRQAREDCSIGNRRLD